MNNIAFPEKFQILHKSLQLFFNKELKDNEISGGYVLYFLLLNREKMTQAQLTKHAGRDKAYTNRIISQLLDKDYVEYEAQVGIKNKKLSLTEKGKLFASDCIKMMQNYICNLTEGISKTELDATANVLERLVDNAKKMIGKSEDIYA